ncbi:MAG: glycoside hydrolase family 127 protein, partial [Sedimentisphaerales bacterium]
SQGFGEPATFYMQSKNPAHLAAAERNWTKIRDLYGQVPGGMFGGDENCRPGFTGPRQAVETCGMVEMMLSDEILLMISGDTKWADRCEDVAFNSLPAAFTPDLKALHYLTAPNMILCDRKSKSPGLQNGGPMLLYDPHLHRCCRYRAHDQDKQARPISPVPSRARLVQETRSDNE